MEQVTNNDKTLSKNFKDSEIICKFPDGTIYLKQYVKRQNYGILLEGQWDETEFSYSSINQDAIYYQKMLKIRQMLEDEGDFE